ncbi:DUF3592 domain-containing protein [Hymenobacter glacieicola]|uniref:DUF3592 domain-containing protein n=1 Tax=Hymenobacter glacieicola TaxID=1562124 RepID=A0ABQ1WUQ3_9BACT|nr:DUF3592 domain-containing protein [Hymenobacter glacieicola]GGG43641.1 hypothetical protein GCM10011378_20040 [Hymenobacter glacieicola]
MPAQLLSSPDPPTVSTPFMLLWMLTVLLIFEFGIFGLYQDAQLRKYGMARRALVVRNRQERSVHILTLRYRYGPDTLQIEHTENHRRQVQELRPGDSVTVWFWPDAPRRVEVTTP